MSLVLIIDDDRATVSAMADLVRLEGFETTTAGTLAEARERLTDVSPDVVLVDLQLPDGNGLELLEGLDPVARPEIVLVTGHATIDSAIAALRIGVLDYLIKPVDVGRLRAILANVSRTLAYKKEIGSLRGELRKLGRFGGLTGRSPSMQKVYDLMARVAPTDATVLITGESGTGKEVVANGIHELGLRRIHPFLPLNCGAISPGLIESELFGHERGSFTGANQLHRGFFERASRGTLFLDEVTEMPLELQVKLLRVLETAQVVRVGGVEPIPVDVRVIAATNRPLEAALRDGKLREDLLYRLNVFPIVIPPLRERGEDIQLLANYFLEQLNVASGTEKSFAPGVTPRLTTHGWPGNVRELKNLIQREFILTEEFLQLDSIPVDGPRRPGADAAGASEGVRVGSSLAAMERELLLATLERCGGNKKQAATILGISLKTLYNKVNQYAEQK